MLHGAEEDPPSPPSVDLEAAMNETSNVRICFLPSGKYYISGNSMLVLFEGMWC